MKIKLHGILRNYQNTKLANTIIHFLSQVPILGYFFHKDLVSEYEAKSGINLAINSISYLYDFLKKIIYVLILVMLFENVSQEFAYFFILLTICGTIYKRINKFDIEDYNNVMLLKIDSTKYVKHKINYYILKEFILLTIALLVIAVNMNINFIFIIYLMLMYIGIHITGEALRIKKIEKNNYEVKSDRTINVIFSLILLVFTILSSVFDIYIANKYIYLFGIVFVISGIVSYRFLNNYKKYKDIHKQNLNLEVLNNYKIYLENSKPSNDAFDININAMNKRIDEKAVVKNKKSYEYLHSMLLKRYQNSLNGDLYVIIGIVILVSLILLLCPVFFKEIGSQKYVDNIFNALSTVFLFMYFISSIGKKMIKLCFFQIDRYLINYNFYRTEESIKENLKLRLKTVITKSLIPTFMISIVLALIFIIYSKNLDYVKLIIVIILPIILSMFYSMYHISTYYLFQPYSFDGEVVNKAYKTLDYIVYLIVYILFDGGIVFNVKTMLIVTILLAVISLILYYLVKKKGVKTFRVR